jgi:hypothetical protein
VYVNLGLLWEGEVTQVAVIIISRT